MLPINDIEEIRQVISIDTDYAYTSYSLGVLLAEHPDLRSEAETCYRKALEIFPNHPYLWGSLGALLAGDLKRYDEAEAAYRKAIELDPNDAWGWDDLGDFCAGHLQRYDEAEAAYRKAIELDPNAAWPWGNLGRLLADHLQRYDEAEAAYRKAVDFVPSDDAYLNSLAWFLFSADKNIEEAEEKARQALAISPNNPYIIHTLACILARRAKWEESALMARRFIVEGDEDYHSKNWPDIVSFFEEAVKTGHAADAVELLDDIGYEDRWRPLREALRAIAEGSDAPLLHVAPEIRQPAEELVVQLLPEGVKLASAIKTPRAKRPRRKKIV